MIFLTCQDRKYKDQTKGVVMTRRRFIFDKLIRDKLPGIMRDSGVQVHEEAMDDNQYIDALKEKLLEEAEEIRQSSNPEELIEELADALEVIQTLIRASGHKMEQVEKARLEKRELKGGFDRKIYTNFIDLDENSDTLDYYLSRPDQYPEDKVEHHSKCLFCQIASKKRQANILKRFKHCYVIKDEYPVSDGHILIIPYDHTENWFTAREEVRLDMMKALQEMKEQLDNNYQPDGYNIGANCGEVAGQSVMHLHMHLIPRYKGDMADPKGGVRGVIPSKQSY